MRRSWLLMLALPLIAAGPLQRPLTLAVPAPGAFSLDPPPAAAPAKAPSFQPAPLPNRNLSSPPSERESNEPSLAPTLFTSREQFRGDGFSPGSTAQSEQERRLKPAAGFSLHMPLAPQ
ncbi:MAG: hypothetical protein RQ966_04750 [Acetobacteraceae bacterium]|nr:hypothetical protein [Acetobacteraceae bacterium]